MNMFIIFSCLVIFNVVFCHSLFILFKSGIPNKAVVGCKNKEKGIQISSWGILCLSWSKTSLYRELESSFTLSEKNSSIESTTYSPLELQSNSLMMAQGTSRRMMLGPVSAALLHKSPSQQSMGPTHTTLLWQPLETMLTPRRHDGKKPQFTKHILWYEWYRHQTFNTSTYEDKARRHTALKNRAPSRIKELTAP